MLGVVERRVETVTTETESKKNCEGDGGFAR